ncbi:MAG: DUF924 family protein [Alphaproteobacteria bacterium]|nr:DUF924 family protein [Alphaproteobacteria bacterium]
MSLAPEDILNFWFMETGQNRWFASDPALDEVLRGRFLETHEQAARGGLKKWEDTPEGMLALLLLLDIFPRRMFRNTPRAYATDGLALELARSAIIKHFDDRIDRLFKLFFYLPFGHAESAGNQRLAVYYIRERTKEPAWIDEAGERQQIIRCFGRFPHRNAALGRATTPEEAEYLAQAGEET